MSNLVILSGGADSAICAAIAAQDQPTYAITFDYGQRHRIEIESAIEVAKLLNLASHEIIDCKGLLHSASPLLSDKALDTYNSPQEIPDGVASTFVPVRNLFFLTIAANRAISLGCDIIYTGVCQTDYSGYPDCRRTFINSVEYTVCQALEQRIVIKTPLMDLTKAESIFLAQKVLGDSFESVMGATHTCYAGVKGGCGKCASCILRDRGFKESGINDPIWKHRK